MKWFFPLLCTIVFFGCEPNEKTNSSVIEIQEIITPIETIKVVPNLIDLEEESISYDSLLVNIRTKKSELRNALSNETITIDSVGNYFAQLMVEDVFPYWKGTPWDFNGHTNIPQEDFVACGYFVSTPLKHVGFKLNRFKLAQQASLNIVKSLALVNKVRAFSNPLFEEMISEIKRDYEKGLYVVGLSNHVGFLYLDDEELYFIHSNYAEPFGVVAEVASESGPFTYSNVFYIAPISNNKSLMRKWLNESALTIVGL